MTFFPTDSSRPGQGQKCSRRVATPEIGALFNRRYATKRGNHLIPALKRRAKLIPTLRVEDLIRASFSLSRRHDKLKLVGHQTDKMNPLRQPAGIFLKKNIRYSW